MPDITGAWYIAEDNPADVISQVGGAIDLANPVQETLNELFLVEGYVPYLGQADHIGHRKVFFRNEGNTLTQAVAFWQDLEHAEQYDFAFEKSADDTTTDEATEPAGYLTGDWHNDIGLINGISLPGDMTGNEALGFWLRRTIPAGISPDTGAFANLAVAGVVSA